MSRRITATLGAALGVLGLVALAAPGLLRAIPTNRGLLLILGGMLVLGALNEVQRRRANPRIYAETTDTEETVELPTPGDDFDHRFDQLTYTRYRRGERERLRDDVAGVAVETLARRRGITEAEARESLEAGTWTDDPYAAALFTGRPPEVSQIEQLRQMFRPGMAFKHRTNRVAAELARIDAGDGSDRETDDA